MRSLACVRGIQVLLADRSFRLRTAGAPHTTEVSGLVTYESRPVPSVSVAMYYADGQIVRGHVRDSHYETPNVPRGPARVVVQPPQRVPPGLPLPQELPKSNGGPI